MTISTTDRIAGPYIGDGSSTGPYAFGFKVFVAADLQVIKTSTAGVETIQTLTTHYSVSLNADQDTSPGGTITMVTAPALNEKVTITSSVAQTQGTDLQNLGAFLPQVIENALDKNVILTQQLQSGVTAALKAPVSDDVASFYLPTAANRAGKALAFDASGNPEVVARNTAIGTLSADAVATVNIQDSAVTTAKIADSNVTTAKIADSNVTTAKIADSNVTTAKLANDAVTFAKMQNVAALSFLGNSTGSSTDVNEISMISGFHFRNKILNGAMEVDQRNAGSSFTVPTSGGYVGVDRWKTFAAGATCTGQRVTGSGGFRNALRITGAASVTGVTILQSIEGSNVQDLAGNSCTLSVYASSSTLTTLNWFAYYANSSDNFSGKTLIASGSFTITSSLTRYTAIFTAHANTTNGLQIVFSTGAFTSGTLDLTGVQVEAGTYTPFERRPIQTEEMLCRRYYERGGTRFNGVATSTTVVTGVLLYDYKRANPTLTYISSSNNVILPGTGNRTISALNAYTASVGAAYISDATSSSISAGNVLVGNGSSNWVEIAAELTD